jgi:hypothetical protein
MPVRRLHRRFVAWLLAFCVLFAQTAALAYGCESRGAGGVLDREAAVPCASHHGEDGTGESLPFALANVCEVHCAPVSLPDAPALDLPALAVLPAWPLPALHEAAPTFVVAVGVEARIASPPPRTLYVRLLI